MRLLIRYTAILLILSSSVSMAASDSLSLSVEHWKSLSEDVDYSENVEPKKPIKEEIEEISPVDSDIGTINPPFTFDSFRTVLFAILIGAAILVIILIVRNARAPAVIPKGKFEARTLDEAEDNLPEVELNNLLQDALDSSNWKIALRINFLMLLQEMIYSNLIIWKKRKTNDQFVGELEDAQIKTQFARTVDVFDPVWYGAAELKSEEFDRVSNIIVNLKKHIKHG